MINSEKLAELGCSAIGSFGATLSRRTTPRIPVYDQGYARYSGVPFLLLISSYLLFATNQPS